MILHRFFVAVVFMCFALTAAAQSGEYRYVIAPILFSESGSYVNDGFTPHIMPGVVLKRCAEKVNYRIAAEYTRAKRIRNARSGSYDAPNYIYNDRQALLRVGIEKGIKIGQSVRVYGALDLAAAYTHRLVEQDGGLTGEQLEYGTKMFSTGLMPALGLEVNLCQRVSLAAETRVGALYNTDLTVNTYRRIENISYITNRLAGFILNIHL